MDTIIFQKYTPNKTVKENSYHIDFDCIKYIISIFFNNQSINQLVIPYSETKHKNSTAALILRYIKTKGKDNNITMT